MCNRKIRYYLVIFFYFLIFFIIGILTAKDYGIHIEEKFHQLASIAYLWLDESVAVFKTLLQLLDVQDG